jgi:hypothetical protein
MFCKLWNSTVYGKGTIKKNQKGVLSNLRLLPLRAYDRTTDNLTESKNKTILGRTLYNIAMSEFAFIRFLSNGLLTEEERKDKNDIIQLTEDVLHAQGLECDASIAKVSADQLKDILEQVRVLRKKKVREKEAREEEQSVQSYIR